MKTPRISRWPLLLAGLAVAGAGCNQQDTACLARIGQKTVARAGTFPGDFRDTLASGWHGMCSSMDDASVEGRVAARLHWESTLADSKIDVRLKDGAIELSGTVADLEKQRRAVAVAESTLGVAKVTDLLQIPQPGP